MGTITDKQMNSKPGKSIWLTEDAPRGCGRFMARILKSGDRLFYFRYTNSQGERVFLPIGNYDQSGKDGLTLREARTKAGELSRLYQAGIRDLREYQEAEEDARKATHEAEMVRLRTEREAAEAEKARQAARKTVTELFEHWADIDLKNRKDGGAEVRRLFEKDVLPKIGQLAVEDVKKGHVTEVVDAQLNRGVTRMAKLTLSLIRQMFRFAVDRDLIEYDPTASIRKSKIGGKDVERDRVLSDDEIKALANQIPDGQMSPSTSIAIWIMLTTCCRIGELIKAEWVDVDLKRGTWKIPPENSKNGKPHEIALSSFAVAWFKDLKKLTEDSQWCYPNSLDSGPVCPKSITKQIRDRQLPPGKEPNKGRSSKAQALVLPGGKWTPHDLRRTGATIMTALGVLPEVAERCLNHTEENKVKRVYQRHSYGPEKQEAWDLLGTHTRKLFHLGIGEDV
ncbi:tyrosine-type recombinase/integrase [Marinobacter alexandrii]|jgi:integrase|uniref:tyrosine-type recombinase/integrase n=1 Tax=Marinobacter alexandrii TaxID=2570351 RepID=UPI002ABE440B|nr:tyrosine-type recombinase/integrase [Marinobacter alexandrii]